MSMLTTFIQALFVRLYSVTPEGKWGKQKGASALEYIVLAAVVVLAIGAAVFLFAGGEGNPITGAFDNLTECLEDGADC